MRRKLVEQGGTTMMVSLPSKWIKRFDLKKGDEVILEEDGKLLHISTDIINRTRLIQIDLTDMNERVAKWILSGLHEYGFDEIEIIYNNRELIPVVNWLLKNLMLGFAIIDQTSKRIVIKNITRDSDDEFQSTLRRAFLVTSALSESLVTALKEKDFASILDLVSLEETNNQLTNFCERILNKRGFLESKKTNFMYTIIWNLEKVCDDFKYIAQLPLELLDGLSDKVISLCERVHLYYRAYYELYYKFDYSLLLKLKSEKDSLLDDCKTILLQSLDKDVLVVAFLQSLVYKITDFTTSMVCMHLGDD